MVEPKKGYENLVRQHFRSFYFQSKGGKVAKKKNKNRQVSPCCYMDEFCYKTWCQLFSAVRF